MVVTLGQQYNTGRNPRYAVHLHYVNRHAETPDKNKTVVRVVHNKNSFNNNIVIDPNLHTITASPFKPMGPNVAIVPVVTKDLPSSPPFMPYDFLL